MSSHTPAVQDRTSSRHSTFRPRMTFAVPVILVAALGVGCSPDPVTITNPPPPSTTVGPLTNPPPPAVDRGSGPTTGPVIVNPPPPAGS